MNNPLLSVDNLSVTFNHQQTVVDDISFAIYPDETFALMGESRCDKSTLGKSLLNLIPGANCQVTINGVYLNNLTGGELRQQRANIQIVFQDPFSSMNPRMLVGDIVAEGIRALHPKISSAKRKASVQQLLQQVDLPKDSAGRYPHEFSGGQRQRICIARALAVNSKLIVCDEPTGAQDVSVQAQVIQLLKTLHRKKA